MIKNIVNTIRISKIVILSDPNGKETTKEKHSRRTNITNSNWKNVVCVCSKVKTCNHLVSWWTLTQSNQTHIPASLFVWSCKWLFWTKQRQRSKTNLAKKNTQWKLLRICSTHLCFSISWMESMVNNWKGFFYCRSKIIDFCSPLIKWDFTEKNSQIKPIIIQNVPNHLRSKQECSP